MALITLYLVKTHNGNPAIINTHTFGANHVLQCSTGAVKFASALTPGDVFCPNPILGYAIVATPGVGELNPQVITVEG